MSDLQTRSRPTTDTPTQTPSKPPKGDGKTKRFLNAMGRGAASVKRRGESVGKSVGETVDKVVDYVVVNLSETDYLRRRQRFDTLVAENKDDGRLTDANAKAGKWTRAIDKALKDKTSDWTIRATMCTVATEALLADIKLARQAEAKARAGNPAIRDGLDRVGTGLDAARLKLPAKEHEGFTRELDALRVELAKLPVPTAKPVKNAPPSPLEEKAVDLQTRIATAIGVDARRQAGLRTQLNGLRTRLSAATEGTADPVTGIDPRLSVSQLLTQADNAVYAFDFATAETTLRDATSALDTMKAPMPTDLPAPQDLLGGIEGMFKQIGGLNERAAQVPQPGAKELLGRLLTTGQRLEAMQYALQRGGGTVVADANRTVESCLNELIAVDETIKGYAEFVRSKTTAEQEVATLARQVREQAEAFYERLGLSAGGDGGFQTRLAGIEGRWTKALAGSLSLKELDQAAYVNELNALSAEILNDKGDPGQVAVEKAASRFRAALGELQAQARRMIDLDSDKAIRLGLTTRPAALEKAGAALVGAKDSALAPAERVTRIDAVTLQITELAGTAKSFDPKTIAFETGQLRERCEDLANQHRVRIKAVLDAVEIERKKTLSISTNKSERDGLTQYGTSLMASLETVLAPLGGLKPGVKIDAGLLGDAYTDLVGLGRRITDFEALGPDGKKDKTIPSFESLGKRVATLTDTLTTHSLFVPRPEVTEPWLTKLKVLGDGITKHDPRQADVQLQELEAAANKAKSAAQIESKEAGIVVLKLRNLAADVVLGRNGLEALAGLPTYKSDLDRRLGKMADDVEAADKTRPEAQALIDEATLAAKSGPNGIAARGKGDEAAKKTQAEYEAARLALESIKEVQLELLEEKAGRLKGEPRKELFKQAKDLRDQVDASLKALEINRDAAAGQAMAKAIDDRVSRIADAPLGSSTRARNNLPAVDKRWSQAVALLHRALDAIPGVVSPICAGDDAAEAAADAVAGKLVGPVKAMFRTDAFTAIMKRIEAADEQGVLAAREDALREVRRLTTLMASDNRVHLLSKVPFGDTVSPFPEIGSALWDLETNLMTSG